MSRRASTVMCQCSSTLFSVLVIILGFFCGPTFSANRGPPKGVGKGVRGGWIPPRRQGTLQGKADTGAEGGDREEKKVGVEGDLRILFALLKRLLADLGLFILHVRHLFSRLLFGAGVRTFEQKDGKYNAAQDPAAHGVHLGAFHPRRPPAACSMQHVSNAATNLIFGAENDRAGSSTSASSPQGARAIVALSQANLIAEAPLRVTARLTPEQDKRSRRGWGLWSGWGRARVREDRGEEDERLMGAASIFYRDDRFYGHLVDGEGRACVDVETWKECVKFGGDIATCWEGIWNASVPRAWSWSSAMLAEDNGATNGKACTAVLRRYMQWELQSLLPPLSTPSTDMSHSATGHRRAHPPKTCKVLAPLLASDGESTRASVISEWISRQQRGRGRRKQQTTNPKEHRHFLGARQPCWFDGILIKTHEHGWGFSHDLLAELLVTDPSHQTPALHACAGNLKKGSSFLKMHKRMQMPESPAGVGEDGEEVGGEGGSLIGFLGSRVYQTEAVDRDKAREGADTGTNMANGGAQGCTNSRTGSLSSRTPPPQRPNDEVLSVQRCETRAIGEACYRWRRKSVYAAVVYDRTGTGHILARWHHWHPVLYDDISGP